MSRLCMKEISRALIEMISDESPYASKDMLCGARGAVFREIFIFHYPGFIKKGAEAGSRCYERRGTALYADCRWAVGR